MRVPSPISPQHDTAPHLASMPLKRKAVTRDKRAPRAPTIVDGFCQLPWLECVAGSVAPPSCPLVREAAGVLCAARREDEQNDSKLATTPDGPADAKAAEKWPRFDGPARLPAFRTVKFTRSIKAVFKRPEKPKRCKAP